MKRIILLSVGFPYGNYEPFLRGELKYYDEIVLASSFIGDERKVRNNLPQDANVELWHYPSRFFRGSKFARILSAVSAIFTDDFWREVHSEDIKPINLKKIKTLLSYISKANETANFVSKEVIRSGYDKDELVFYSYWMDHLSLAAIKLARKYNGKAIARCHGYDVYPRDGNYVVMQRYLTRNLDRIFPIAEDGKRTICALFDKSARITDKIHVFRLGTVDHGLNPIPRENDIFTVVSCSNVVPLKRVDLIFDAINSIKKFKIRWIHFGDGAAFDELKDKVAKSKTIHEIELRGRQSNQAVMEFYKTTPIHLLINLSTSEGIPVSMMEALSFGIPCIGTDVGGVHEIIENGVSGFLIPENSTATRVASELCMVKDMPSDQMISLRESSRNLWLERYQGEKNYRNFVKYIMEDI